jgi:hypothetical protein
MCQAKDCLHLGGEWEWRPHGFKIPLVPAYAVYCTSCDSLLFTTLFDGNKHILSIPNFHTIRWRDYILGMFKKRFPQDDIEVN